MPLPRITELLNLLNVNELNRGLLSAYSMLGTLPTAEDSIIQSKRHDSSPQGSPSLVS